MIARLSPTAKFSQTQKISRVEVGLQSAIMNDQDPIQESGFFRRLSDLARRSENRSVGRWIRTRLLVGFMVALPLVVTIFFARFIFGLMDKWFRPISERIVGEPLVGVGMVVSLLLLFLLGVVSTNVIGGRLISYFEKRISGLPLLSPIYQGARQITEAIQIHETAEFQRVVLIPFPNQNVRSLGFVTRDFKQATAFGDEPTALVFVPTTPNPTSGYLVVAKLKDLSALDVSVEEGVKLVLSGGLLTPTRLLSGDQARPWIGTGDS
jgi:uncharacterized membrane protein